MRYAIGLQVAGVLVVTFALGFILAENGRSTPMVWLAYAACEVNPVSCTGGDDTLTSVLEVAHEQTSPYPPFIPVQPDSGETWKVEALYASRFGTYTPECACQTGTYTAYVDVDYSNGNWTATCTSGCDSTNGPIFSVIVCAVDLCNASPYAHSWTYKMAVNLNNLALLDYTDCGNGTIHKVTYTVLDGDDGYLVDDIYCELGDPVTFDSTNASTVDVNINHGSRCPFNCGVTGASISLQYE